MRTTADYMRILAQQRDEEIARQKQREQEVFERRTTPVLTRLKRLIDSMPELERQKPRPLEFFRRQLISRCAGQHAHVGETGEALRALGWTRRRNWSTDSKVGYRAMWYPPTTSLKGSR